MALNQQTNTGNSYISSYWRYRSHKLSELIREPIQELDMLDGEDEELISTKDEVILHDRNENDVSLLVVY
jgi:hypothetical protein